MDKAAVCLALGLNSTRSLDRLISQGRFPRGIRSGPGKRSPLHWTGADVAAYLYLAGRCREGPADPEIDPDGDEDG